MRTAPGARDEIFYAFLDRQELVSGGEMPWNWTADGALWFATGAPEDRTILRVDLNTGETAQAFDVAAVRATIAAETGYEPPGRGLPFDSFTQTPDGRLESSYGGTRWRLDPARGTVERMGDRRSRRAVAGSERLNARTWKRGYMGGWLCDPQEVPETLSPDGEWFAGIRNYNIVLRSTRDGRDWALTNDGTPDRFWDIDASVDAMLLGRVGQTTSKLINPWSPDSVTLLGYRQDVSSVYRIPRIHYTKQFEEVDYTPYEKAGARLNRTQPIFVDICSSGQTPVALPQTEDHYIQLLSWLPDSREALLIVYARDVKRVDIFTANRETGAIRLLMTERSETAVKIQIEEIQSYQPGFYLLPDGSGFLWRSSRDGWDHLYRYDLNGRMVGQLTSGEWSAYEVVRIAADGFVYFIGATDIARPYDLHVCRVSLQGGKVEQLTHEKGQHSAQFAPNGEAFLDIHSAVDRPARIELLTANGKKLRLLSDMDISRLKTMGCTPAEEFVVRAADGKTDLWGVMYKPVDFDPSRSYPIIEHIYGGPQVIYAQRSFAINNNRFFNLPWALAQLGYIVINLDARGTPGRGKEFQDFIHGRLNAAIPDHAGAIRQLCERYAWMDGSRVGIYGHSWGGHFSTCALMYAPETYHACVSSEPAYDPWHGVMYEPYLGLPQKNRAAYEDADIIRQVAKLRGKLMIVTGTRYNHCVPTAYRMTRALIESGIDHEFVVLPDANHGFVGAEFDYYLMKLIGWFDRHVRDRNGEDDIHPPARVSSDLPVG